MKRVACFFSGGYTESSGAFLTFLQKIAPEIRYSQCMPNRTVKRNGMNKLIKDEYSGITGSTLLNKIKENLRKEVVINDFKTGYYDAILIEDDIDNRFKGWSNEKVNQYIDGIRQEIEEIIGKNVPIVFLYAAPEIESWFIVDWEKGFGGLLLNSGFVSDIEKKSIGTFNNVFHRYVIHEILRDQKPEEFVNLCDEYQKLSDKISDAFRTDVIIRMKEEHIAEEYCKQICNSKTLYYSKRIHGSYMLARIRPEYIKGKCGNMYDKGYSELKKLESMLLNQESLQGTHY